MTTGHEEHTSQRERTEFDRLIKALEPDPAPMQDVVSIAAASTSAWARALSRLRLRREAPQRIVIFVEGKSDAVLVQRKLDELAHGRSERELALRVLAVEALERIRVYDLADRLEQQVDALEAEREQAAEVKGERESDDPWVILQMLPDSYHEEFEADYRRALRIAGNPKGFLALRQMLRQWRARAEWYSDPDYLQRLDSLERGERPAAVRSWADVKADHEATGRLQWR